jgi:hypothetical protein
MTQDAVAATANPNLKLVCPTKVQDSHDVIGGDAAGDHGRPAVNHGIPDGSSFVIAFLTWCEDHTLEMVLQHGRINILCYNLLLFAFVSISLLCGQDE